MTIVAGTRLGPYEIEAQLGAGGMGEVYRARDVRLDRTVAVKVLSQRVLHRAESRKRFEREARVIASLNQLLGPNTAFGNVDFGRITGVGGFPRMLQLMARFAW